MIGNAKRFDEGGGLTNELAEERVHQPAGQEIWSIDRDERIPD